MDRHVAEPSSGPAPAMQTRRIGPVSRGVRLLLAVVVAWFLAQWIAAGPTWFAQPSTLSNPWVWLVTAAAVYYGLHQLVARGFGRRCAYRVVVAFGVGVLAVLAVTLVRAGELWAAPLTTLLYGLDVGFLTLAVLALIVSIPLGTPGCDIAAIGELIRRVRGTSDTEDDEPMWCVAGLHRLDLWEARQRWHRPQ